MGDKNKDSSFNESSILLKYPVNIFSSVGNTDNILMPVQGISDTSTTQSTFTSCENSDIGLSTVCQLQQPLLFGAPPLSSKSGIASSVVDSGESTEKIEKLFQDVNIDSSNNEQIYSSNIYQESIPVYSSYSSQMNPSIYPLYSGPSFETVSAPVESTSTYYPQAGLNTYSNEDTQDSFTAQTTNYNYSQNNSYTNSIREMSVSQNFEPLKPYWLFKDIVESKEVWKGFSESDSEKLENFHQQGFDTIVSTDGGRYDVYLKERIKKSVYFDSKDLHVRRSTWFCQHDSSMRFVPYEETISDCLEAHYRDWMISGVQEFKFTISGVVGNFLFEKPLVMLHYGVDTTTWTTPNDPKGSPRIIKRGVPDGFQIMPNESSKIDHLLFIVQGIGSFCDLRFRTVFECVDGFRDISNKLISSHFKKEVEQSLIGRVEILPVAWHSKLRHNEFRLDRTMQRITLPSIPKLRLFTNDTLIDILLYNSSSYCQSIISTVTEELNNLYEIFLQRNQGFSGKVFVAGHSLGSLILFDILSNQTTENFNNKEVLNQDGKKTCNDISQQFENIDDFLQKNELEEYMELFKKEKIELSQLQYLSDTEYQNIGMPLGDRKRLINLVHPQDSQMPLSCTSISKNRSSEENGIIKIKANNVFGKKIIEAETLDSNIGDKIQESITNMNHLVYSRLSFHPAAFFALGSPISMFLAIRGFDSICEEYSFPTCPAFFHIFHPYDPVAFRVEPLIDHNFKEKPVLIPHHKGRKRMHLEIKENVAKFANEFRQKIMDTFNKTWHSFYEMTGFQPYSAAVMEQEVNAMVPQVVSQMTITEEEQNFNVVPVGKLNGGRRIDHVLQEKPLEALNDYVWALTSHATYWDSEDTVLMILREIYGTQGINVSPLSEADIPSSEKLSLQGVGAGSYLSFPEKLETNYSQQSTNINLFTQHPSNTNLNVSTHPTSTNFQFTTASNVSPSTSGASVSIPGSQHIGPPPLSGFVKRSAFSK